MEEHYTTLFFSVFLHVLLLFIFLTIFFWTVIRHTESHSLYNELDDSIDKGLKCVQLKEFLPPEASKSSMIESYVESNEKDIKNYFDGYFSKEDSTYKRNNSQLLQFNIVIIALLFLGLLATIFVRYLICGKVLNFGEIIGENLLILIFVGAIEYYFFMNIASKYVPVKPSYMPSVVQKKINEL